MPILKRPGGRCGIVVPDSFLFQTGTTIETRRLLLTNFNLHTIVRLSGGVFAPYTNIPTSILFFEASEDQGNSVTNPCTKEIWYYEIPLPEGRTSYTRGKPIQYEVFHNCILWWNHRQENGYAWQVPVGELFAHDCNLDVKNPQTTIEKANGNRLVIKDDFLYEFDASDKQLRQEPLIEFVQRILKQIVKTPEDLRVYWMNRQERKLLIEELAIQGIALNALASALHLSDVDHYDLLLHVLFQQPTRTRGERVQRLQATYSTFFQRFEHNPSAKELLDTILDMYIQGNAPDVSSLELLSVPPLSAHSRREGENPSQDQNTWSWSALIISTKSLIRQRQPRNFLVKGDKT